MSFLKKIDCFPYAYSFLLSDSETHKSVHGGCLSIISLIFSAAAFILFSQDFIHKKNPHSFTQKQKITSGEGTYATISNDDFNVHFRLADQHFRPIHFTDSVFFVHAQISNTRHFYNKPAETKHYPIKIDVCDKLGTPIEKHGDTAFCFDFKEFEEKYKFKPKIGGTHFSEDGNYTLRISMSHCDKDIETGKTIKSTCIDYEAAKKELKEAHHLLVYLPSTSVVLKDYENPLKSIFNSYIFSLSAELSIHSNVEMDKVFFDNDKGWIFEEIEVTNHLNIENVSIDYQFIREEAYSSSHNFSLAKIFIGYSGNEIHHYRSYIKLQQCFANVGGVLKIITMILGTVAKVLSSKMLKIQIVSKFYTFDKNDNSLALRGKYSSSVNTSSQLSLRGSEKKRDFVSFRETSLWELVKYLVLGKEKIMFNQIFDKSFRIERSISIMKQMERNYTENPINHI